MEILSPSDLNELRACVEGEVLTDTMTRLLYATDASPYQRLPIGVVRPRHRDDCVQVMRFAVRRRLPLIPRGAGTSLAGQCIGSGLVVDMARHLNRILEIDPKRGVVRVQPGVVLADLNDAARMHGLIFPPDPSTANRCNIGGMVGNNAWGVHALRYGTTRDYVDKIQAVLSDGTVVCFGPLDEGERARKLTLDSLEGRIYRTVSEVVDHNLVQIRQRYPSIRGIPNNAGYALDVLAYQQPWNPAGRPFNLAPFLCGSEGTLALITEVTLRLEACPRYRLMVCAHFGALDEAMQGIEIAMSALPVAVELLDRRILDLTLENPEQGRNRFWIKGEPEAVLLIELNGDDEAQLTAQGEQLIDRYRSRSLGYAWVMLSHPELDQVWELRRAGLGLLMGMPGDRKAVSGIEDTAVAVADLPQYVSEVLKLVQSHGTQCVVYGSVSMGTLHFRPELDLSSTQGREVFEKMLGEVAALVARYRGSFSAKHGDGRLRAPFLEQTLGKEMVRLLRRVKLAFDPLNLLNPGKILDPPPVTTDLRFLMQDKAVQEITTDFDWSKAGGWRRATERCHGAGACLKGLGRGTMCPSYMATREEMHSTRGRANLLRQALTSPDPRTHLTSQELYQALDLCLACKGCRSECPANVDMARMKAEFLQHYHAHHGTPWRAHILGRFAELSALASYAPRLVNMVLQQSIVKQWLGFHPNRALPKLATRRFSTWFKYHQPPDSRQRLGPVIVLVDPFIEFYEPEIGQAATECLEQLGYEVGLTRCLSSGRVEISQGLLHRARITLTRTLQELHPHAKAGVPIVGLEPSEILTFRDEAQDLLSNSLLRQKAKAIAEQALTFEEFIVQQSSVSRVDSAMFACIPRQFLLHVHCHQKAIVGLKPSVQALGLIPNAKIQIIPSGCCGMAGAFGYEAEHCELSQRIGELVLFPAVRTAPAEAVIVATGTSCRHQILAWTGVHAWHPAQVFRAALGAVAPG